MTNEQARCLCKLLLWHLGIFASYCVIFIALQNFSMFHIFLKYFMVSEQKLNNVFSTTSRFNLQALCRSFTLSFS